MSACSIVNDILLSPRMLAGALAFEREARSGGSTMATDRQSIRRLEALEAEPAWTS